LIQVIRLVPNSESQSHLSRAAPVSSPLQYERAGEVFMQEATQGGVVVWARVREKRGTRRNRVVFMLMSLKDSWKASAQRLRQRKACVSMLWVLLLIFLKREIFKKVEGRRNQPLAMAPFGKWKGLFQQQEKERSSSLFIPLVLFKNGKIIIRSNLPTRVPRKSRMCERQRSRKPSLQRFSSSTHLHKGALSGHRTQNVTRYCYTIGPPSKRAELMLILLNAPDAKIGRIGVEAGGMLNK